MNNKIIGVSVAVILLVGSLLFSYVGLYKEELQMTATVLRKEHRYTLFNKDVFTIYFRTNDGFCYTISKKYYDLININENIDIIYTFKDANNFITESSIKRIDKKEKK